jgi:hypothetical protein
MRRKIASEPKWRWTGAKFKPRFVGAPKGTPSWLLAGDDRKAVQVAAVDEVPGAVAQAWFERSGDSPDEIEAWDAETIRKETRHAQSFWNDLLDTFLVNDPERVYDKYAKLGQSIWSEGLREIDLLHNGEGVGWFDLDAGIVQFATLYDLVHETQPMIVDDRRLFLMTETMWEEGIYPPEVGELKTSKVGELKTSKETTGLGAAPTSGRLEVDERARGKRLQGRRRQAGRRGSSSC